jgi:hypothetical protein
VIIFLGEVKKVVMVTKRPQEKEQSGSDETKEITFKCKYCGKTRSLDDMRTVTRFFPPVVACRDCAKKMQ